MTDDGRVARGRDEIDVDDLQSLLHADDPETIRSAMDGLRAAARDDPAPLDDEFDRLCELLEHADREVRAGATISIAALATHRESPVAAELSTIAARLDDDYELVQWNALTVFRTIAAVDREALRPYADDIASFLDADSAHARRDAAFCLGNLAAVDAEAVVDAVPELASVFEETHEGVSRTEDVPIQLKRDVERDPDEQFEDEQESIRNGRVAAGHALFEASTAAPGVVGEHLPAILGCLDDDEPLVREVAADVIFGLASAEPSAAASCVDQLENQLAAEHVDAVRASLVQALNAISVAAPDAVGSVAVERADVIRRCLDAEEAPIRGAAAGLLGLAAGRDPTAVTGATDRLRELSESDEVTYVREAAEAALGHV